MDGRRQDCDLGLLEFYHRYTGKPRDLFDLLCVRHKVILEEKNCETCGKPATMAVSEDQSPAEEGG